MVLRVGMDTMLAEMLVVILFDGGGIDLLSYKLRSYSVSIELVLS